MYIAELKGKLSAHHEILEDVLTSNVFSFFKYSNRRTFLKPFLMNLGIKVIDEDVRNAEFVFWPVYEDGTEPDVVVIVGGYYILFEAKYYSDFGPDQLKREIEGGRKDAQYKQKQFFLVAITADYSEPKEKFHKVRQSIDFRWVNWQFVTAFLEKKLEGHIPNRLMAEDLYSLLIRKDLRKFEGFADLPRTGSFLEYRFAFFNYISAKYRGDFIGFDKAFSYWKKVIYKHNTIFIEPYREFSWAMREPGLVKSKKIFMEDKNGQKSNERAG
ncbi:MAG: hypothetical protein WBF08_00940 [Candidatus Bathyarchaeia archaeon]